MSHITSSSCDDDCIENSKELTYDDLIHKLKDEFELREQQIRALENEVANLKTIIKEYML